MTSRHTSKPCLLLWIRCSTDSFNSGRIQGTFPNRIFSPWYVLPVSLTPGWLNCTLDLANRAGTTLSGYAQVSLQAPKRVAGMLLLGVLILTVNSSRSRPNKGFVMPATTLLSLHSRTKKQSSFSEVLQNTDSMGKHYCSLKEPRAMDGVFYSNRSST